MCVASKFLESMSFRCKRRPEPVEYKEQNENNLGSSRKNEEVDSLELISTLQNASFVSFRFQHHRREFPLWCMHARQRGGAR
jgi:hypothetical protein